MPVSMMLPCEAFAPTTPRTRLVVDTMPSFAPSTAARNQLRLSSRCRSTCFGFLMIALPVRETSVALASPYRPSPFVS